MVRDIKQIYWLAGILEGEGCFYLAKLSSKYKNMKGFCIKLAMTDKDVVERSAKIIGNNTIVYRRHNGLRSTKDVYIIRVTNTKVAISWMMTLYPLMGIRRKIKIKELIDEWKNYSSRVQKSYAQNGG
jgi:hypothetical protein